MTYCAPMTVLEMENVIYISVFAIAMMDSWRMIVQSISKLPNCVETTAVNKELAIMIPEYVIAFRDLEEKLVKFKPKFVLITAQNLKEFALKITDVLAHFLL